MRARSALVATVVATLVAAACGGGPTHAGLADDGATLPPGGGGPAGPAKTATAIDPKLAWSGYAEGSAESGPVALAAYHDPDGKKGINALVITEVSFACNACVTETSDMQKSQAGPWSTLGVHVLQLVVDDAGGHLGHATVASAKAWRDATGATWAVVADPAFSFSHEGGNPMPQALIVNPRNLSVVLRIEGYDPGAMSSAVKDLAHANGAK